MIGAKPLVLTLCALASVGAYVPAARLARASSVRRGGGATLPVLPRAAVCTMAVEPAEAPAGEPLPMEVAVVEAVAPPKEDALFETLKTGSFFALWYLFNIINQIYNKKALNALPIPYTMAALQLFVGIPYCLLLWTSGLRKTPKLSMANVRTLAPTALLHLGTHLGAVVSLGAGAVSFTHIIKASEPVVSAALSALLLGAFSSLPTYLTLVPIVGGVALASLKDLSFTWVGFIAAMLSNLSSALRAIYSKKAMGPDVAVGENMGEANLYGVLTIFAFLAMVPISLLVEPPAAVAATVSSALAAGHSARYLWTCSILSGFFFYLHTRHAQNVAVLAVPWRATCSAPGGI